MTDPGLITRRMLLRDMGKAGLAVVVFGATACTAEGGDATTTSGGRPSTSTAAGPTTTGAGAPGTTAPSDGEGAEWQRVNLGFVSAYILYRGGEAAIIDTGVAGSGPAIEAALTEIGLEWSAVGHVIVTHQHDDHQGGVPEVLEATEAPWYAGSGDLSAISAPTEGASVGDGDVVFDLEIIETPGHTPGHIAVLDPVAEVLVAGDALTGGSGRVAGPNPQFTPDMATAGASVVKLAGFSYEVALFGHGEPVLSGASDQVAELAATLG